jgi:hypothetical protein
MALLISYRLHDHMVLTAKLQIHLYSGLSKFVPIVSLHVSLLRLVSSSRHAECYDLLNTHHCSHAWYSDILWRVYETT